MPSIDKGEAIKADFICKLCGTKLPYEEIVEPAIKSYCGYADEVDIPIADCPECGGIDVYLYNEKICSWCGLTAEHECQRCGTTILSEELQTSPLCGYCAHMMAKDD